MAEWCELRAALKTEEADRLESKRAAVRNAQERDELRVRLTNLAAMVRHEARGRDFLEARGMEKAAQSIEALLNECKGGTDGDED